MALSCTLEWLIPVNFGKKLMLCKTTLIIPAVKLFEIIWKNCVGIWCILHQDNFSRIWRWCYLVCFCLKLISLFQDISSFEVKRWLCNICKSLLAAKVLFLRWKCKDNSSSVDAYLKFKFALILNIDSLVDVRKYFWHSILVLNDSVCNSRMDKMYYSWKKHIFCIIKEI